MNIKDYHLVFIRPHSLLRTAFEEKALRENQFFTRENGERRKTIDRMKEKNMNENKNTNNVDKVSLWLHLFVDILSNSMNFDWILLFDSSEIKLHKSK